MELEKNNISDDQFKILIFLTHFSKPVSVDSLFDLLPELKAQIQPTVSRFMQLGWINRLNGNLVLSTQTQKAAFHKIKKMHVDDQLSDLFERLTRLIEFGSANAAPMILSIQKEKREKNYGVVALNCAMYESEKRRYPLALDLCREAVLTFLKIPKSEDFDRSTIKAALLFSDLNHRLRRYHPEAMDYLNFGKEAALRLGDQRNLALIYLHFGRNYAMRHMTKDAIDHFSYGLELVKNIGDKDIIIRSAHFSGHYYFLQGMCKEAIDYCEMVNCRVSLEDDYELEFTTPINHSLSSLLMFKFHTAIGVMHSSWRSALLDSDYYLAAYYRAFLGQILLMSGRIDDGIAHLHAAEKEALENDDTYTIILARRCIAIYYYLKNNMQQSYEYMKSTLSLSRKFGLPRPFYAAPWILELLYNLYINEYPSLPDYNFQTEIKTALEGPNAILRGVALRISAQLIQKDQTSIEKAESLLLESELELTKSSATIELAKTWADMAVIKLAKGEKEEAIALSLKAWEAWNNLGHTPFPEKLKALIENENLKSKPYAQKKDLFTRYLEITDSIVPSENLNDLLSQLINLTCQFFEAERGGLFLIKRLSKNDGFVLRNAYNLSPEQIQSENFRTSLLTIARCYEKKEPIMMVLPKLINVSHKRQTGSILCIPFDLMGNEQAVLYFDKAYSDGGFEIYSKIAVCQISRSLSGYVKRIHDFCNQITAKSREVITDMTVDRQEDIEITEGLGEVFQDLIEKAETVARSDATVLITGETGVGKELIAKRIHLMSSRRRKPYIPINPTCIPENLVESELFGHEKGAFTGAEREKPGRIEVSNKGTLFIDEVGEIPKFLQVKLLRALEDKSFVRIGGVIKHKVDFRLITATNRDLVKEVESGNFRQDLFFRLCVVSLRVPPLRERGNDVIRLAQEFIYYFSKRYNLPRHVLSTEEKIRLREYSWPGNVRELKNVIEHSVIMSRAGKLVLTIPRAPNPSKHRMETDDNPYIQKPTIDELQRDYIKYILKETHGKIGGETGAANILGLKRPTLYKRMKKLGISTPRSSFEQ